MNEKGKDQVIKRKEGKMKEVKRKNEWGRKGREEWNKDERHMLGGGVMKGEKRVTLAKFVIVIILNSALYKGLQIYQ